MPLGRLMSPASLCMAIEGLIRLGILYGGMSEEIYASGVSRVFFRHGLGHHLGLEVYDVSPVPLLSTHRRHEESPVLLIALALPPCTADSLEMEEGMVVTVEPGIYFSRYALEHVYLPLPK